MQELENKNFLRDFFSYEQTSGREIKVINLSVTRHRLNVMRLDRIPLET